MSTGEKFLHFADYVTDRLNPILVKETRQALKSRQFIVTFMLLLTIAWMISVFGAIFFGPMIEYGSTGRAFFVAYFYVIGFATLFVVPFGSFRSMLNERDHNTYELLSISTLSPQQIVTGKLMSSLVQVFIYYSAIAPFIAFTSLLQGFDLAMVTLFLTVGLFWSVFVSMISLMLSTLSNNRQWQSMNTIGMIALLLWQMGMALALSATAFSESIPFDDQEFWWVLISLLLAAGTYFFLARQIAVSRLTFESDNRSSGIRIICTLQFWLVWAGVLAYGWWNGSTSINTDMVLPMAGMLSIHWMIAGLFFSTESDHISRRVRRSVPRSKVLRLLTAPWMPGGRRGFLLLTIHILALILIGRMPLWREWVPSAVPLADWDEWVCNTVTVMALYVYIYAGVGAAFGRWGQRITTEFRAAHARVLTILVSALVMIIPYLPVLFGFRRFADRDSMILLTNPFSTIGVISEYTSSGYSRHGELAGRFIFVLLAVAGTVFLINLRAVLVSVRELVNYEPEQARNSAVDGEEPEAVVPV